ncbi:MAG: hypothetical protein L0H25_08415, partial [Micrococcales bacterium]|nr:hypothetical protein [Micrococcales bacterium]
VATALALPAVVASGEPLPNRDEIVTVALMCVLLTLVVQGLTLTPLTRLLGVGTDADEATEIAALRVRATEAALVEIRERSPDADDDVREAAIAQYEGYLAAQQRMDQARASDGSEDAEHRGRALESLLRGASDVERQLVLRARRRGEVSAGAADEVLRDIENRALRDFS